MSGYEDVDEVIQRWVESVGSTLFTEWQGPARYFHLPGDPPFECFQISVKPPHDGRIMVRAGAIDTNDNKDDDMYRTWEGALAELDAMLGAAVAAVEEWRARERKRPDPPSPW